MDYDLAIIGGGSAGYAAARTAVNEGLRTVVIDGGEEVGGLCILRGCMPSKCLIESANRNRTLHRASEFGLRASGFEVHVDEIIARKRRLIAEFADYRREQLESGQFDFIRGMARFIDPHTVAIKELTGPSCELTALSFLIATGSVINSPSVPGLRESAALTSDDLLDLESLPESMIVLGAGPVALEMAHYLDGLGVRVTIIQRSNQLLTGLDPDVAGVLESAFRERGISVWTGTMIQNIERTAAGCRVTFRCDESEQVVEAEEILNCLGRHPAISDLDLEAAGVAIAGRFVAASDRQQTSQAHIFAAGDCAGPHEVVHVAIQQGEIAARNAARLLSGRDGFESIDYRLALLVVFTEPEIATVGLSEAAAAVAGIPVRVATYPFADHGKSMVMGETEGFVKLLVDDRTGEIIGGAVAGPRADDLIHEIVVAMHFRATAAQLATIPHYHPTLSEIWTYPAEELAAPAASNEA